MDFRDDINMLRALAVTGVVLFHFGATAVSGGFAGVDVFFVISGFLMTRIIVSGVDRGDFSFARFVLARAKRIVPALLVLVFVLMILGYFFLSPKHYEWFGRDAGSAVVFVSNLLFAKKIDYFAPAGEPSWLLHTWSLSVEWQFYLLFPLCVMILRRCMDRKRMVQAIVTVAIVSLIANVVWTQIAQTQAFYALGTRIWMFIAGGMVYLFPRAQPSRIQAWIGLLMILASYVVLDETKAYPGLWAIAPVFGTLLVIHANAPAGWMRHPVIGWTGKLSYSLYLWHWPVAVFATYAGLLQPAYMAVWVAISALLSWVSFVCVEEPFRRQSVMSVRHALFGYIVAILCVYGMASVVHNNDGFVWRVPPHLQAAQDALTSVYSKQKECMQKKEGCLVNGDGPAQVVLWGDSHADALAPAFEQALISAGVSGKIFALSACPPVPDWVQQVQGNAFRGWSLQGCRDFNRSVIEEIEADTNVQVVILAANWIGATREKASIFGGAALEELSGDKRHTMLAEGLTRAACGLSAGGKRVYIVAPVPEMPHGQALSDLKRGFMHLPFLEASVTRDIYDAETSVFRQVMDQVKKACPINVIDVAERMCPSGLCRSKTDIGYLYRDTHHLTIEGALLHVDNLVAVMP